MSDLPAEPSQLTPLQRAALALAEMKARLERAEQAKREPVAIVGMGCRFPGGSDSPEAFWKLLDQGVDAIREMPEDRWDLDQYYSGEIDKPGKICTRRGGFINPVDEFDAAFFGISPREAASLDPQQRFLLEVSWHALESAGIAPDQLSGSRTGVFMGIGQNDYARLRLNAGEPERITAYDGTGNGFCFAAGRVSYVLGLRGPNLAIDTACSSSLVAVHLACQSLRLGECDLALAGGVQLILSPEVSIFLSQARALSPTGRCRSFDAAADGFGRGEGCGVIVLKRLSDVRADEPIIGLVRGSAVNHDGASSGFTAPSASAQETLLRDALAFAGVRAEEVDFVEAHGTGTILGDPIELAALGKVFGRGRPAGRPLMVGSVKSNIGHLEAAAGIAGLMSAVLALSHSKIPKTLHFTNPNPHVSWDTIGLKVANASMPWPAKPGRRIAGVSSFGISGTNAHVLIENAPTRETLPNETREDRSYLLLISAKTPVSLERLVSKYAAYLRDRADLDLGNVCYTAARGRSHYQYRAAFLAVDANEMRQKLQRYTPEESETCVMGESDQRLGKRYLQGDSINWDEVEKNGRRVALPQYEFDRQRHWVREPSRGTRSLETARIQNWIYEVTWEESGPARQGAHATAGIWVIFGDRGGTGKWISEELARRGEQCVLISEGDVYQRLGEREWRIGIIQTADHERLWQEVGHKIKGVLHLWSLDIAASEQFEPEALKRSCGSVLELIKGMEKGSVSGRVWVVSRAAMRVRSGDKVNVWQTPVWGLGKVVGLEHPKRWGGSIDLAEGAKGNEVVEELLAEREEEQVAYREGKRYVARLKKGAPGTTQRKSLDMNGSYLITGGLGALGMKVAEWLVERGVKDVALMSRRGMDVEVEARVKAMLERGARVLVFSGDVAEEPDVRRVLGEIKEKLNPLKGVIHAAGTNAEESLTNTQWESFVSVLAAKVIGAWNLHQATKAIPLDLFVLFSSIASVWGSRGQGHYAAANQFLDGLAQLREHAGLAALSINWGPWAGAGMALEDGERLVSMGIRLIEPAAALQVFGYLISGDKAQQVAADIDWPRLLELFEAQGPRRFFIPVASVNNDSKNDASEMLAVLARLKADKSANRGQRLTEFLQAEVTSVLGFQPGQIVDPRKGFFSLGMDSLMAVELRSRLVRSFGSEVPSTVAFDYSNIETLAGFLGQSILRWDFVNESDASTPRSGDALENALQQSLARLESLVREA